MNLPPMSEISTSLLIVEADAAMRDHLAAYFEQAGYAVRARKTTDGVADQVADGGVDLCLIDIDLPDGDGLELTVALRDASQVGIILMSESDDSTVRVSGLKSGGDICITKPFDDQELLAQVEALLRRVRGQSQREPHVRRFAGWTLDMHRRVLITPAGKSEKMSLVQCKLLQVLIDNAEQALTHHDLIERFEIANASMVVNQVRTKLRRYDDREFITNIHGHGYQFTLDP